MVVLYEVAIVGFGLMFAATTFLIKAYNTLANIIQFTFLILAGVFYPPTLLPPPISTISLALPFTYYVDAIKHAAIGVEPLMNFGVEVLLLGGLSIFFLVGGIYVFDRVERSARARGSIATS